MKDGKLGTESYKGVRDFYPEDMAIQSYIFDTWRKVAESFGFERYDASVLEPSELYKSKGAENEEMVNEQTYTFMDRGDREVTLRPEMTPTVARMVAGRRRELGLPVRWYSIPNLFRYERAQRGRLREHWQLNADIFGSNDTAADVEIIFLAHSILKAFGAKDSDFEIRINDRKEMREFYNDLSITDEEEITKITRLNDRFHKISRNEYEAELVKVSPILLGDAETRSIFFNYISGESNSPKSEVLLGLEALGITNVKVDRSLARGFDYYTGTIFEIFDTDENNRRSLLGGGRYDNLTGLFGGDAIPAVGFGMGDVTMRDFLETHDLLPKDLQNIDLAIIPLAPENALDAEKIAQEFRATGIRTYVSLAHKKVGEHIKIAEGRHARYIMVVGADELGSGTFKLKELATGTGTSGSLQELVAKLNKSAV